MKTEKKTNCRDAEARRIQRVAGRIARYLFTGRRGEPNIRRLVVERVTEPVMLAPGHCKESIQDIIAKHLLRVLAPRRLESGFTEEELKALALVFGYLENDLGERKHFETHRHEGHIWLQIEKAKAAVGRVSNGECRMSN